MTDRPEIQILTVPKWFLPTCLFIATISLSIGIYLNSDKWSLGNVFDGRVVEAQESYPNPNKFGVNSAVWVSDLSDATIRNTAALTGPGATIVGVVGGVDSGWVGTTKSFIDSANKYCLTPILRLDAGINASDWGSLFSQIGGNNGKLVISIGNEVNFKFEFSEGWPNSGAAYAQYLSNAIDAIRPHVGDAKIIGSPLNTSAPCPGNDEYICWVDFVAQMQDIGGWKGKVDGHASNPYPVEYQSVGRVSDFYQTELSTIGYSKSVYILETGPHNGTATGSPQEFMDAYWDHYCGASRIAVVNFFNAAGNNPDPRWTGEIGNFVFTGSELDGRNLQCPMADQDIRFSNYSTCEIVPRSEYTPMSATSGGPKDVYASRCVASLLTRLEPRSRDYSGRSEIQLNGGNGGVYGEISVESVTVADLLQDQEVERHGDTVLLSEAAQSDKDWDYDLYYNVDPNYPADGKFDTYTKMAVLSWPNSNCVSGALDSSWIPIPTSWACTGVPEYGWANEVSPPTWYVEETPEEGNAYTRTSVPMYFPLGTALGAVTEDPYNYFIGYEQISDFKDDMALVYEGDFVGDQTVHVEFMPSIWDKIWEWLPEDLKTVFRALGIRVMMDNKLDATDVTSISVDGGALPMGYYYDADEQPGELNIPLPSIDYMQDCGALWKVYEIDYPEKIERMRAEQSGCTSCDPECLALGGLDCCDTDNSCWDKWSDLIDEAYNKRGRLHELWEQCVGNGKRPMEILGHIDNVMAPFVQILAHRRLQQVILTEGGILCDVPEENLFAAEVTLNVKWYDKNEGGGGNAYMYCPTGNLLVGGDMEEEGEQPIAENGVPVASGSLPKGWKAAWKKNGTDVCAADGRYYCKAPEFNPQDAGVDQRRVLEGSLSWKSFSMWNAHDIIYYQTVSLPAGTYDLSAYFQGWRMNSGDDAIEEGGCAQSDPYFSEDSFSQICIKEGELNLSKELSPAQYDAVFDGLRCTSTNPTVDNTWVQHYLSVSGGKTVTILLRGKASFAPKNPPANTDDYWDNICLVPQGELESLSIGSMIEIPRRRAQSSSCEAVTLPEKGCEIEISGGGGAPIVDEDLIFYMPGLGVIPYLDESINMGDTKSTNRAASDDLPYCKDREVSDMPFGDSLLSGLSALDVYIYQNLPSQLNLDTRWLKAIWPAITDDALVALGDYSPIEDDLEVDWAPDDCKGGNAENERLILEVCDEYGLSKEQKAYVLATALGECSVTPIGEYGCYSDGCDGSGVCNWMDGCGCEPLANGNQRSYGCPDSVTGLQYYGRGFVQLTWKGNYIRAGNYLGIDLVNNPEMALDSDIAAEILVRGMQGGWFTGKKLSDYINDGRVDYVNARRIINGTSAAEAFAERAQCYLESYPNL